APGRRHQQRRHRLDPDPDGQVGAAPYDVDDEQADPGGQADPPNRSRFFESRTGLGGLRTHTPSLPGGPTAHEWQDRHLTAKSCHGYGGEYASGVSDLTRSPWLRAALLAGAVGLAGDGLVSQWGRVRAGPGRVDGWGVGG